MMATLAALVLGLLIASAKVSFDRLNDEFTQTAATVIMLDRTLADYGPETRKPADSCAAPTPLLWSSLTPEELPRRPMWTLRIAWPASCNFSKSLENWHHETTWSAWFNRRPWRKATTWRKRAGYGSDQGKARSRRHSWRCLCSGSVSSSPDSVWSAPTGEPS